MAKMGSFRSPKGVRKPALKLGMEAPQKPGKVMPSMGAMPFKKGGMASKKKAK